MKKIRNHKRMNLKIEPGFYSCLILIFQISLSSITLPAQIITVRQDGTGDFTVIQEAVNAASDGDTVLVWPGTYYENLDLSNKTLTLASLNLTTNDPSYIEQTIINGNRTGSCILLNNSISDSASIVGFSLTNGSGTPQASGRFSGGGGIRLTDSNVAIINCKITENEVHGFGGGICSGDSYLFLSGTTINNNHCSAEGGGLFYGGIEFGDTAYMNTLTFDSLNRCNIYLNFAYRGCDVFKWPTYDTLQVYLDTFTVFQPDVYHYYEGDYYGHPLTVSQFHIQHEKLQSVAADLYVNPSGDNENSGLTPDDPLQSIAVALAKIIAEEDTSYTIHLANGIYSKESNNEKFSLCLRSNINLVGESRDSVILDADSSSLLMWSNPGVNHYTISNLTLFKGFGDGLNWTMAGSLMMNLSYQCTFENILISGSSCHYSSALNTGSSDHVIFRNVEVSDCKRGSEAVRLGSANSFYLGEETDTCWMINCKVNSNGPGNDPESRWGGGLLAIGINNDEEPCVNNIIGCEFIGNISTPPSLGASAILATQNTTLYLVNSTIADNFCPNPNSCALAAQQFSDVYVYNSLLHGNTAVQTGLYGGSQYPPYMYFYNTLVQGGKDSIYNNAGAEYLYYDISNINADPLFDTSSIFPYSLSAGSPCIDAGTLNLPPGITLPEYDLAGNPRVWGESVDMGAYEYGPWVRVPPVSGQQSAVSSPLQVSPNPFSYGTYVSYESVGKGRLRICVYSLSGMMVRPLINSNGLPSEKGNFYWDGTDNQGNDLPAGVYLIEMTVDDEVVGTVKVVKR